MNTGRYTCAKINSGGQGYKLQSVSCMDTLGTFHCIQLKVTLREKHPIVEVELSV